MIRHSRPFLKTSEEAGGGGVSASNPSYASAVPQASTGVTPEGEHPMDARAAPITTSDDGSELGQQLAAASGDSTPRDTGQSSGQPQMFDEAFDPSVLSPSLREQYDKMLGSGSVDEQRSIMRQYEKRVLNDQAHMITTMWWYKINVYRSYVKGWKISPSHYLNQHLDQVWLDK